MDLDRSSSLHYPLLTVDVEQHRPLFDVEVLVRTREDYCAWLASGFQGPPPILEPVTVTGAITGQEAILGKLRATRPLELWRQDPDGAGTNACENTRGAERPWATGSALYLENISDLVGSGSRVDTLSQCLRSTVEDQDGALWQYSFQNVGQFHLQRDGQFFTGYTRTL